jgi:hypothetical protein
MIHLLNKGALGSLLQVILEWEDKQISAKLRILGQNFGSLETGWAGSGWLAGKVSAINCGPMAHASMTPSFSAFGCGWLMKP